jgi:hypothetical protein
MPPQHEVVVRRSCWVRTQERHMQSHLFDWGTEDTILSGWWERQSKIIWQVGVAKGVLVHSSTMPLNEVSVNGSLSTLCCPLWEPSEESWSGLSSSDDDEKEMDFVGPAESLRPCWCQRWSRRRCRRHHRPLINWATLPRDKPLGRRNDRQGQQPNLCSSRSSLLIPPHPSSSLLIPPHPTSSHRILQQPTLIPPHPTPEKSAIEDFLWIVLFLKNRERFYGRKKKVDFSFQNSCLSDVSAIVMLANPLSSRTRAKSWPSNPTRKVRWPANRFSACNKISRLSNWMLLPPSHKFLRNSL